MVVRAVMLTSRLLRWIITLCVSVISCNAVAVVPVTAGGPEVFTRIGSDTTDKWYPVVQGCTGRIAIQFPSMDFASWRYLPETATQVYCEGKRKSDGSFFGALFSLPSREGAPSCPANSTMVSGSCQCNTGFEENTAQTACVPKPTGADKWKQWCQAATGQQLGFAEMAGRNTRSGCQNLTMAGSPISTPGYTQGMVPQDAGCTIALGNSRSFPDADGSWYTQGDASVTGGTCREGDPTAGDPAGTEKKPEAKPPVCPGGYQGSVNGTLVCAKPDTNQGVDWAGTKTQGAPDGTTTTTQTDTKCKGGMCDTTTTETKRDANGNVTGTSTTTTKESAGSLCARDKGNGACTATGAGGAGGGEGDGTGFSGTCATGFKAVSDNAVLNAMAEEQYRQNCKMYGDPDSKPQVLPKQTKTATLGTVTVGGWGSSCPQPVTFAVLGQTYQISFQPFCDTAPLIRPLVLLACALIAMGIVYSALRGSQ